MNPAWWRRPGDVTAVAVLIALPLLIFAVPALLGHAVLPGDDMTQNFPLRVLAGRDIRAGRLPLFDPYIWSGAPLLAGWNAGAAYPLTMLFAVLPGVAAWSAGMVITWAVAGLGMFGFLRALRLGPLAGFLGALSFALAGAMSAQVTHFGLVAGMSWVPLALLAVLRLTGPPGQPGEPGQPLAARLRWAAVLGASLGLVILAGEPRAIADGAVIVGCYALWQLARLRRRAPRAALPVAGGALLGLGLGAIQWLPGLAAIATSQRGNGSLALFSSGSLPDRWLLLTLVPDLLGGSGSLSQPSFFGSYNLTEVTSYVGILPLVAAFAMVGRVRWRPRLPDWLIWHVLAVLGVVLALGGNTPAGALLYRVPLFGGQRLQSRNILVLDLALAVLLAYWVDHPVPVRAAAGSQQGAFRRKISGFTGGGRPRAETLLGLLPPAGVLVIVVLALTWGAGLLRWLGTGAVASAAVIGRLVPWLLPYGVLAAGAAALAAFGWRLRPRWRARLCAGFVVTDIVVFSVLAVVSVAPAGASGGTSALAAAGSEAASAGAGAAGAGAAGAGAAGTASAGAGAGAGGGTRLTAQVSGSGVIRSVSPRPVAALGYQGRFAIYDPGLLDTAGLSALMPPDLNGMSVTGMPSVQGYTSLVDSAYAAATGSHDATGEGQNVLSPAAVGNGTLDQLDTSVLLTLPAYLTTVSVRAAVRVRTAVPVKPAVSVGATGPAGAAGQAGAGRRNLGASQRTIWYLGASVPVTRVTVPDAHARSDAAEGTEIGLTAISGTTRWFRGRAVDASELAVSVPVAIDSVAIVARAGRVPAELGAPTVIRPGGQAVVANGPLQNALVPPRWTLTAFDGAFAVFKNNLATGPLTIEAPPGAPPAWAAGASVRYVNRGPDDPVRAMVTSAHGIRLVRAVAAIPGWTATWRPAHGARVSLPVRADGLVQVVAVPAGQGTVTWRYRSPRVMTGLVLSLAAALLILLLGLASYWPRLFPGLARRRAAAGDWEEELAAAPPLERADV